MTVVNWWWVDWTWLDVQNILIKNSLAVQQILFQLSWEHVACVVCFQPIPFLTESLHQYLHLSTLWLYCTCSVCMHAYAWISHLVNLFCYLHSDFSIFFCFEYAILFLELDCLSQSLFVNVESSMPRIRYVQFSQCFFQLFSRFIFCWFYKRFVWNVPAVKCLVTVWSRFYCDW